ncbi:hypothetical protein I4F81_011769 [Pyropia yezoensis]|uniref:Uncharacterized protein n=1 Tax=Pyropia yezoensis TaxID=2788 RepID=A0ACC3CH09_PYRYE|nr:hypothetical protein I4F81_011769 [Neopyropia yezoensis]
MDVAVDDAADGYPSDFAGEHDAPFDSQPPPPLPLSQLLSQSVLPGFSAGRIGGLLPTDTSSSLGGLALPRLGSVPATLASPRVDRFLGLAPHPLGSLPPRPREPPLRLPPLSYIASGGHRGVGGGDVAPPPGVSVTAVPETASADAPSGRLCDPAAATGGQAPTLAAPGRGSAYDGCMPSSDVCAPSQPVAPFFLPPVESLSCGSPASLPHLGPPSGDPLTAVALRAINDERPLLPALPSPPVAPATDGGGDPASLVLAKSKSRGLLSADGRMSPAAIPPAGSSAGRPRASSPAARRVPSVALGAPVSTAGARPEPPTSSPLSSPRAVQSTGATEPSTPASEPASSTPPSSSAPSTRQTVPVSLGPGGLSLMQAISTLARQLVDGHRGPVKLTGFYAVLQASTDVKSDRPQRIIIDCCGSKKTVEEKDLIMAEWSRMRVEAKGAERQPRVDSALKQPPPTSEAAGEAKVSDASSGSDDAEAATFPEMTLNSSELLMSFSKATKGVRKLSEAELKTVLTRCGLRSDKQLTHNIVKSIFKKAHSIILGRGMRKGAFSWTLVTPPELLVNKWSVAGASVTVDGRCFFSPDSKNTSQRGVSIERRRIALCIAAHISPFWSAVLRGFFVDNPVNKVSLPKRFRGGDDAFASANGRGERRKKLRKLSKAATAKGTSKGAARDKTSDPSDDEYDDLTPDVNGELPLAPVRISELAQAAALSFEDLLLLDFCPLLPSSAVVAIESLPTAEFETVCRDEGALRVVLPRELIKRSFQLLEAGSRSSDGLELDGRCPTVASDAAWSSAAGPTASLAVSIKIGEHPLIRCSSASLVHMSSVQSLNEQLRMCLAFKAWMQALKKSTQAFPWDLEFLVGCRLSVADAADQVLSACAKRRMGDTAWRFFLASAGVHGDAAGSNLFGGCAVAFSDIILGGQREFMTNGVLDAALAEMRVHPALRLMPAYVLLTSQSASFTTCNEKRVAVDDAVRKMKEIYDVMPPARYERILMMLNLAGQHWISAEVLLSNGTVNVFDSSDGGFKDEKDLVVARVVLFAQQLDRLRRLSNPLAPPVRQFRASFINAPVQRDGYNCGAFALAHLWCAANGLQLCNMTNVVGDHLRLGLLWTLLDRGKRYEDARLSTIGARVVA